MRDVSPRKQLNVRSGGLSSVVVCEFFTNLKGIREVDVFHSRFLKSGAEIVLDVSFNT